MKDFFSSVKFKVLLVVLVLLAGVMTYAAANGRLTAAPQELLGAAMVPLQRITAGISSAVEGFVDKYVRIDQIIAENEELTAENAALREQMVDYDLIRREVEQLRQAWEIKEEFPDRQIVNANVIGRDPLEKYYAFTIDKGSRHGIEVKDCVITASGIVGRVIEVGPNYAKVATILDPSVSVGCMVSRTGDIGLVGGDGELAMDKYCAMTLLPGTPSPRRGTRSSPPARAGSSPSSWRSAGWSRSSSSRAASRWSRSSSRTRTSRACER